MEEVTVRRIFRPFIRVLPQFVVVALCTLIFLAFSLFLFSDHIEIGVLMLLGTAGCSWILLHYYRLLFMTIRITNSEISVYIGKKCHLRRSFTHYKAIYIIKGCAIDQIVPYYSSQVYLCFSSQCCPDRVLLKPFSSYCLRESDDSCFLAVPFKKRDISLLKSLLEDSYSIIEVKA